MTAEPLGEDRPENAEIIPLHTNSRGRRIGDHGNRAPEAIRPRVLALLWKNADPVTLQVGRDVVAAGACIAGVTERQVWRWWKADREKKAAAALDGAQPGATLVVETDDRAGADREFQASTLLRTVARSGTGGGLVLTTQDIAFLAGYPTIRAAYLVAKGDPKNRLRAYAERTVYAAAAQVHPSTWPGLRKGDQAARAKEAHPSRVSAGEVSQSFCHDQYQIKGRIRMPDGSLIEKAQILPVTWEASGLPAAYDLLTDRGKVEDSCRVLGEAVRGWSYDGFEVAGTAAFLRTDQAAEYVSEELGRRARHIGCGTNPGESYSPGGNGDAEAVFSIIGRELMLIPGTSQWAKTRSGISFNTGEIAWETVAEIVDRAFATLRFEMRFTKGEWAGWTRFEKHRELVRRGALVQHRVTADQLAHLAPLIGNRKYDPKKGVEFQGRQYNSRELANNAPNTRSREVSVGTLVDEGEIFVFDAASGDFLGTAVPHEEQDDLDKAGTIADRAMRSSIRTKILKAKSADLQAEGDATVRNQGGNPVAQPDSGSVEQVTPDAAPPPAPPITAAAVVTTVTESNAATAEQTSPPKATRGRTARVPEGTGRGSSNVRRIKTNAELAAELDALPEYPAGWNDPHDLDDAPGEPGEPGDDPTGAEQ